eukprot:jgi/Chlat1/5234/Chrsp33S05077
MHLLDFKVSRGVRGGKGKVVLISAVRALFKVRGLSPKLAISKSLLRASHNRGTVWHSTGREEQASSCGRRLKGHGDGLSTVLGLVMQA